MIKTHLRLRFMISGLAALPTVLLLWPPNALLLACGDKSGAAAEAELGDRQLEGAELVVVEGEVDGLLRAIRAGWGLEEVAGERERCARFPLPGPNCSDEWWWLEEVLIDGRWGADVGVGLRTTFDLSFFPLLSSMTVLKEETLNRISSKTK